MKLICKKSISFVLSLIIVFGVLTVGGSLKASAATFADINQSSVWIKQSVSGPCVLDACAMMIRRTLIATGNPNWASVTESSLKSTACQSGSWSVYYSFDYMGVSVRHTSFDSTASSLKNILNSHPEGIVLFSRSKGHAVLVTDYSGDTFFCADPAYGDKRNLNTSNQGVSYSNSTEYWYVSSPTVTLTSGNNKPQTPTVNLTKTTFLAGETININYNISSNTEVLYFTLERTDNNTIAIGPGITLDVSKSVYSTTINEAGTYSIVMQAVNGYGASDYLIKEFTVVSKPSTPIVSLAKTAFLEGETININYSISSNTEILYFTLERTDNNTIVVGPGMHLNTSKSVYTTTINEAGTYAVVMQATNGYGSSDYSITEFTVGNKPQVPVVGLNKESFIAGDTVDISYSISSNTEILYFTLERTDNNTIVVGPGMHLDTSKSVYSVTLNDAGTYAVVMRATNSYGAADYLIKEFNVYNQLTYNANGGSGAPLKQIGNGNITLSSTKPTKSGYTFQGWATSASATSAQYQPGATFSLTANTTLYAVWKQDPVTPTTFTLTYDANNGTGAPSKQTGNGNIIISSTKPTRDGYKFLGWATSASATSAQYQPGSTFNLNANTTLYAIWQKNETPDNPPVVNNPTVGIKNYKSSRSEAYKTTITFTAVTTDAPTGSTVHWIINGKDEGTGDTFTVEKATSTYTIQTRLVGSNNAVLAESEVETVNINSGFFARLIAFFRQLFGSLPVMTQSIKEED